MKPLQRLPQQPLKSPKGERLVLSSRDDGYPINSSPGRGVWFGDIASTDTKTFLQVGNLPSELSHLLPDWNWPAVVLTPEECRLHVGGMSVAELRSQLEKYWGRGGVPGAAVEEGYQDVWVPAWVSDYTDNPYSLLWKKDDSLPQSLYPTTPRPIPVAQLDAKMFSHWVNGKCAKWLNYFITRNHTLGAVHAWFTAFLGVTRDSILEMAKFLTDMEAISRFKFRMSFDMCIKDYDEIVNGIPSLPHNPELTKNKQGVLVINNKIGNMFPRRIWDICANTVIPATWVCGPRCPLTGRHQVHSPGVRPVSHAWATDRTYISRCGLSHYQGEFFWRMSEER